MNYSVALLFNLIGFYEEMNTVHAADQVLGAVHFTSYSGHGGKCAVHFVKSGGDNDSYVTVTPNVDEAVNPHYIGLRGDKPARSNYTTYVMPAHHQQGFGDYVLLNMSSEFGVNFESRDVKTRVTKVISCDASSCTCTAKP
jgi:hypothetical protein